MIDLTTVEKISLTFSGLALLLSLAALYIVNFWRGKIKCAKPAQFFFGYKSENSSMANISINCFLYSTGVVGRVVEHMYMEVEQGETKQIFNSWFAGSNANARVKLGGVKISRDGISLDSLFVTPSTQKSFRYSKGEFTTRLFIRLSGEQTPRLLVVQTFNLTEELHTSIENGDLAVFEINSSGTGYHGYADTYSTDPGEKFVVGMVSSLVSELDKRDKEKKS